MKKWVEISKKNFIMYLKKIKLIIFFLAIVLFNNMSFSQNSDSTYFNRIPSLNYDTTNSVSKLIKNDTLKFYLELWKKDPFGCLEIREAKIAHYISEHFNIKDTYIGDVIFLFGIPDYTVIVGRSEIELRYYFGPCKINTPKYMYIFGKYDFNYMRCRFKLNGFGKLIYVKI